MKEYRSKICFLAVLLAFMMLGGCGSIYTNVKTALPSLSINANAETQSRVGTATCSSYMWLVSVGDCSTAAAMKNGNISKVHHVDYKGVNYFLGVYMEDTLIVYGE